MKIKITGVTQNTTPAMNVDFIVEAESVRQYAMGILDAAKAVLDSSPNEVDSFALNFKIEPVIEPKEEPIYYQVIDEGDENFGLHVKKVGDYVENGKVDGIVAEGADNEPLIYIFEQVTMVTLPY